MFLRYHQHIARRPPVCTVGLYMTEIVHNSVRMALNKLAIEVETVGLTRPNYPAVDVACIRDNADVFTTSSLFIGYSYHH